MVRVAALVVAGLLAGCAPVATVTVTGTVLAGPVCPVEQEPPDPACAPRPVEGAVLVFTATGGRRFETVTDAAGGYRLELPPGSYLVEPQPVQGLMGTAPGLTVEIRDSGALAPILYDTGIR